MLGVKSIFLLLDKVFDLGPDVVQRWRQDGALRVFFLTDLLIIFRFAAPEVIPSDLEEESASASETCRVGNQLPSSGMFH